ncbi:MAG: lysophospholipid acyltransferase family protein [Pseudomonadota bacterium]
MTNQFDRPVMTKISHIVPADSMVERALSVVRILGAGVVTLIASIGTVVFAGAERTRGGIAPLLRLWAKSALFLSKVNVKIEGLHHVNPSDSYIFMTNHQSMYDILVVQASLPVKSVWFAKVELFRIPVFGRALLRADYIPVDRSSKKTAFQSLEQAINKLKMGFSIVIFPEGSRSSDGNVKPFKRGGVVLAMRSGRPIVPVSILGSGAILPKGRLQLRPGTVFVKIHQPIETACIEKKNIDLLIHKVQSIIASDVEAYNKSLESIYHE